MVINELNVQRGFGNFWGQISAQNADALHQLVQGQLHSIEVNPS